MNNSNLLKYFNLSLLFLSSLITFNLGNLFYISTNGPDFDRYKVYIEYFYNTLEKTNLEQGLAYFFVVSLITNLRNNENYLYINDEFLSNSIQVANFLFYIIGLVGLYFLLKKLNVNTNIAILSLTALNFFPPMFASRIIYKPEIMIFGLLPWLILFIDNYKDSQNNKYIYISLPLIILISSSKGTVALIVFLFLILNYYKIFLKIELNKFFIIFLLLLAFTALVFNENHNANNYYTFQHNQPESYNDKADISFAYNINLRDLYSVPFSNYHRDSFISITLLDTFGDYFNIYWNNDESLFRSDKKIFFNSRERAYLTLFLSSFFYLSIIYVLSKKIKYKYLLSSPFIGMLTMLGVSLFIQFNSERGDMVKTYYYSYLLGISFVFLIAIYLKYIKRNTYKYISVFIYILLFLFLVGFPKTSNDLRIELISQQNNTSILCRLNNNLFGFNSECMNSETDICTETYDKDRRLEILNGNIEIVNNKEVIKLFDYNSSELVEINNIDECNNFIKKNKSSFSYSKTPYLNILLLAFPLFYYALEILFIKKRK
tara:strand:+ start:18135 stop:19772 length:1638 start_codon:yes stop_codon:yes gene_type:complete